MEHLLLLLVWKRSSPLRVIPTPALEDVGLVSTGFTRSRYCLFSLSGSRRLSFHVIFLLLAVRGHTGDRACEESEGGAERFDQTPDGDELRWRTMGGVAGRPGRPYRGRQDYVHKVSLWIAVSQVVALLLCLTSRDNIGLTRIALACAATAVAAAAAK